MTSRHVELLPGSAPIEGLGSLVSRTNGGAAQIRGCSGGSFRVDFGTESGGWLELVSDDIPPSAIAALKLGISETNFRLPGKVLPPVAHPGGVYRLETGWAIYEGVRFGKPPPQSPSPPQSHANRITSRRVRGHR